MILALHGLRLRLLRTVHSDGFSSAYVLSDGSEVEVAGFNVEAH